MGIWDDYQNWEAAVQLGVTDKAVAKRCRKLGIRLRGRGQWTKTINDAKKCSNTMEPLGNRNPT